MPSLPTGFIQSLQQAAGFSAAAFEAAHQQPPPVSIRLHPQKRPADGLPLAGIYAAEVPWCSLGRYLTERPSFTADPLLHAGAYYVQEASSMFLEQALLQLVNTEQPLRILDLCAAPGGKSTLLLSFLQHRGLLVSNEVIRQRVHVLAENITKWGYANTIVTHNDPADFQRLPGFFDVLVVDAPCSGSGLFRKDPAAMQEWSSAQVTHCSQRQQRILADVLPALAPGGLLIYSTCSYAPEEDEAVADRLCAAGLESQRLSLPADWGVVESASEKHGAWGYRFYPDRVQGEGFYLAAFRKPGGHTPEGAAPRRQKSTLEKAGAAEKDVLRPHLADPDQWLIFRQQDQLHAFPAAAEAGLSEIRNALYIRKAGVELGTLMRNELIPGHALALSLIRGDACPSWELNADDALQYLRRQDFPVTTPHRGWVMITHRGLPLGWAKVLPNRLNNYYPKDWRILNK